MSTVERLSHLSGSKWLGSPHTPDNCDFNQLTKSPDVPRSNTQDVEEGGGALRAGGAPRLLSKESCGLLAQYAAVGLVYGTLPSTITPFLTYYLNMEGTATTSARALLAIPWSLKVFIGMLSDNVPLFGYRRRPYMVLGWSLAATCLFIMAAMPLSPPYFQDPADRRVKPQDYDRLGITSRLNPHAADSGGMYIVLMMLASLGYLIADVAADAVVVEYAQREPEAIRGRTQTAIYTTRTFFGIFAQLLLAFGLSSAPYGGDFDFGMSFSSIMLVLAIVCVVVIPVTWLFITENVCVRSQMPAFSTYIALLWDAIQSRAFYQVIAYSFVSGVFASVSYVAHDPITSYWVRATSFNLSLSNILGSVVTVITLIWTGRVGLHWNWRTMMVLTMLSVIALDAVTTMLVTWDVVRNQWFWLGVPIVEQVPASISFIISTFIVVELAGEGTEGACYGLLTTVMNLSSPFALTITKNLNAPFQVNNRDILTDSTAVRRDVTITILLSYVAKLFSLVFLVWLPRQKAETQALKEHGGRSKRMGILTVSYCGFALVWSILTNLFAIFESTKCLKITGGCHA
ncbi:hypothetical protein Poli38472_010061 [Pythium oligandrum]|uniref:Uncharacterized protein n=1 Tax=Pythium oligandrum TaxID=41045 RepID=A0A8K1FGA7_PYTOL|nr:hypothetical protein Poli38472_010061 [Pythium oligandrum]|eukprot:TMW58502.1 hypothetical protein Poli38472_010061 [Pythium oligandrum]